MPKKPQAPLVLVDGSSYLFRAYHAMPSLTNSKGQHTGAIYGVVNMMKRLLKDYGSEHIAVVFDAKGKTFRNDMYKEYKANRPPMPDDLREQIKPIHEIIDAMGLPLLVVEGVEADDVIGTLAQQATEMGMDAVISTGDKDMAQLVNRHVTLVNTMTDTTMDIDGVKEKFGVTPAQIIDYLALIGDTVDNVPGVPKVGPKTAVKWLDEFGSLDTIMQNAEGIKGKVGENLRDSLDFLPLSRELVTIKCDVALDVTPDAIKTKPMDNDKLIRLFQEFEFKTWLKELLGEGGTQAPQQETAKSSAASKPDATPKAQGKGDYTTIFSKADLNSWLGKLKKAKLFAFDLETTSLDYMQAEIVGLSFAIDEGEAAYVPLAHDAMGDPAVNQQLDRNEVLALLKPLLEDPSQAKLGQNLKYDKNVLANYDINMQGIKFDSMLESYVLNSTATRHNMDTLALKYLGYNTIHFEDIAGKGVKQLTFNQIDIDKAAEYAAEDADITLRLHNTLWPMLQAIPSLAKVFNEIEMPLLPILAQMEYTGVLIDTKLLAEQSKQLAKRLQELEREAYNVAGEEFNLGSPKQIQTIFFDKLKLPVIAKTPKGQPSTAENVLEELAAQHELPRLILEHRGLSKLKSTYTDKLPDQINKRTGRVHTSYHQAVAATGRLSSSDPNLQNIPIRTEEGRRIRKAFIAAPGTKLIAADYSQIELRIMAHLSNDPGLLKAFNAGEDVHRATAAEVFGLAPDQVTSDQRRSAKAINFGLIYGMSAFGLAKQLDVGRNEAQEYIDLYFKRYPGVKDYMEQTRLLAKEQGYVETVFGRRLYIPEINASNAQRRQYAERTAINAPMQGTAADIIKRAMINLARVIPDQSYSIKMIMQVHDELVFEVAEEKLTAAEQLIRENMVTAAELKVPLVVDVGTGDNWDEAH
ncbi:MAG: DNA polymerase I [Gammaproteobacteria bacterium]|nr:DNA polymerase I [Gammaproteobacteria bacterium]